MSGTGSTTVSAERSAERPPGWAAVLADVAAAGRTVLRAWPRAVDHLLLELGPADDRVPAQWFASITAASAEEARQSGAVRRGRLLLQPGGVDRRLPGLATRLAAPGTELISHRPGRRAVLRESADQYGSPAFTKVVRPGKVAALAERSRQAEALDLRTPAVLGVDRMAGTVTTAALPGVGLADVLAGPEAASACRATGAALARLHRQPIPAGLAVHDLSADLAVADRWRSWAEHFAAPAPFAGRLDEPVEPRPPGSSDRDGADVRPAVLHRDFHDGQVLVDGDRVGVIDFDLMAVGDPALDLGNLVAHLELRELQGVLADARPLVAAVLDGYRPGRGVLERLPVYRAATRRRLHALYAFRTTEVPT